MKISKGSLLAGIAAQLLGQALTGWSLVLHAMGWPDVSVWVMAPLFAAILVPFRHDGTLRDRATGNFGASVVVAGFMWWEVIMGGFEGIIGGSGFTLGVEAMIMLAATVLFSVAGAVFWTMRDEGGSSSNRWS